MKAIAQTIEILRSSLQTGLLSAAVETAAAAPDGVRCTRMVLVP